MCGIVGILGASDVAPNLLQTLQRLEYRGYDSSGIATLCEGAVTRRRAVGKIAALGDLLDRQPLAGRSGIAHTRWATHGSPNQANAHPHRAGKVVVVHNGIIENYAELRQELMDSGARDEVTGMREMLVGSDALALAPLTDQISYLEEGDVAVLSRKNVQIYNHLFQPVDRDVRRIELDEVLVDKGEHKHFMHKEIHEQPASLARVFGSLIDLQKGRLSRDLDKVDFSGVRRVVLVACGTAYYAASVAKYWFEEFADLPVELDVASEFRYRSTPLRDDDMAIFVSQSGETADTLAALRHVKGRVRAVLAVVNVPTSSIAREADHVLEILAGPEIGVASTKAYVGQLALLAALALKAGKDNGLVGADAETSLAVAMAAVPRLVSETLSLEPMVQQVAATMVGARDTLFLGRGVLAPLAFEAALKLKEISYIHAEGYAAGELKHGPIALIDEHVPVIVFASSGPLFEKTISNVQEVIARGARVTLITDPQGAVLAKDIGDRMLIVPTVREELAPFVHSIVAQLLAYHVAVLKGTDVDQPRNLAKSVTVE